MSPLFSLSSLLFSLFHFFHFLISLLSPFDLQILSQLFNHFRSQLFCSFLYLQVMLSDPSIRSRNQYLFAFLLSLSLILSFSCCTWCDCTLNEQITCFGTGLELVHGLPSPAGRNPSSHTCLRFLKTFFAHSFQTDESKIFEASDFSFIN